MPLSTLPRIGTAGPAKKTQRHGHAKERERPVRDLDPLRPLRVTCQLSDQARQHQHRRCDDGHHCHQAKENENNAHDRFDAFKYRQRSLWAMMPLGAADHYKAL